MTKDAVKVVLPKALKRWFKTACTQNDTEMSTVATELFEEWCLRNNPSITIAQLVNENFLDVSEANISNLTAISHGHKPSPPDLIKLSSVLGIRAEVLQVICDRTFNGNGKEKSTYANR